jgi:urease accessory protein
MLELNAILGTLADPEIAAAVHHAAHHGGVEYLHIPAAELGRRRLRIASDRGTDCAIALARDARLQDGAVLWLTHDRAIVVRLGEQHWLRLRARDAASALELGYHAGNLHWTVRFEGGDLLIAQNGPVASYLARIAPLMDAGRVVLQSTSPPA